MQRCHLYKLVVLAVALGAPLSQARAQDSITITKPAAGEVYEVGSTMRINWETNLTDVTLRFSKDDGATWTPIVDTVDTTSADWLSYPWQVPDEISEQCKIHIEGYYGEAPTDSATFQIQAGPSSDGGSDNNDGDDGDDGDDGEEAGGMCAALGGGHSLVALIALAGLALVRRRRG